MNLAEFKAQADAQIRNADAQRTAWEKRLKGTEDKVYEVLKEKTTKILTKEAKKNNGKLSDFVKELPEYKKMQRYNKYGTGDMTYAQFCKNIKEEDIGLFCDIIGRFSSVNYMNFNANGFEKKLEDAYSLKSDTKKSDLKVRANEILKIYDEVLANNAKHIAKIESEIEKQESRVEQLIAKRTELSGKFGNKVALTAEDQKAKEDEINRITKEINDINNNISIQKNDLKDIIAAQHKYEEKITTIKYKFMDKVTDETNVRVGSYDSNSPATTSDSKDTVNPVTTTAIRPVIKTTDSNKQIAKKMLLDIRNMDKSQVSTLINQYGYEDLYEMSKNLGVMGRTELRSILDNAIGDNINIIIGTTNITSKDIRNIDMNKLECDIQNFMDNIDSKTFAQISVFEEQIEKLNLLVLRESANTNKITRFFGRFTKNGVNFNNLNLALRKFSNLRYERETVAINAANSMRQKIHVSTVPDRRPRTYVDKKKQNQIRYDRSR